METKTAGFSASPNYFYLVSTTAGSTFDVYVPYQTNFAVGDRIKIFNTGDGVIRLIETISGTSITPYEGTTGVYGTYRNVNSKCLVELVAINTQTWSYVIIPQLELDESTLTKTGEVFAYNLAEKAMKALAYTFPSADGIANQVLQTNGSGALSFATVGGGGWTYSAITADPANAQAGYHYSCTGTFTITLPTSGVSAGQEIRIKNMGTGTITIDPQTQNIDGTSTDYVLDVRYSAITLVSTGSHWEII